MNACLYSCVSYPARKSYHFYATLYCHVWPVWLYHIFPHYLINGTIFGKKVIKQRCVLIFSTTFVWNISLKRIQRDIIINVHKPSCKVPVNSCQIITKLEFNRQIFEKYSNIKFLKNPFTGSRVVPCGRTDRYTKLIVAFRNFAKAPKNYIFCPRLHLCFLYGSQKSSDYFCLRN
jgi:hypothetical protein